jgi:hypothetical protein
MALKHITHYKFVPSKPTVNTAFHLPVISTTWLSQSTFSQLIFRQKPTPVLKHPLYIFGHMTFMFPDLNLLEKAFLNQLNKTPPNLRHIKFLNEGFGKN